MGWASARTARWSAQVLAAVAIKFINRLGFKVNADMLIVKSFGGVLSLHDMYSEGYGAPTKERQQDLFTPNVVRTHLATKDPDVELIVASASDRNSCERSTASTVRAEERYWRQARQIFRLRLLEDDVPSQWRKAG